MARPPADNCCAGFTRAAGDARRRRRGRPRRARASGIRACPIPAGAGIDRRRFLLAAAGGLMSVYGAGRLGLSEPGAG